MKDLKLCGNEEARVEYWSVFEKVADENKILYESLSKVKKTPEKFDCELCFLFSLLSEEITPKLVRKISIDEAKKIVSILWGCMERKGTCSCGIIEILNTVDED
jgi:hypothetical protein